MLRIQEHLLSSPLIEQLKRLRMINGDDRFRATKLTPAQVEAFDAELGIVAQKSKQEEFVPDGVYHEDMLVTYLKTGLIYVKELGLRRVDSIAKLILGRYNPERPRMYIAPYSLFVDAVMAAVRAYESPILWIYVAWLYSASEIARKWLEGRLQLPEIFAGAVIEQMLVLKATRGKKWLKKKKIDPDYIISEMSRKYGLSPDGHRASQEYFSLTATGEEVLDLEKMPIYQALRTTFSEMSDEQKRYFVGLTA